MTNAHGAIDLDRQAARLESDPRASKALGLTVIGLMAAAICWSALFRIDIVSVSTGSVVPAGKVHTVEHYRGGVVTAIAVQEGDVVEAGQVLLTLDPVEREADAAEFRERIAFLEEQAKRLQLEVALDPEGDEPDADALTPENRRLFGARLSELRSDYARQREVLSQRRTELGTLEERQAKREAARRLTLEQVAISETLVEGELSNRYEHLELLRELNAIDAELSEITGLKKQAEAAIQEAAAELSSIRLRFQRRAQEELDAASSQLRELQARLPKIEDGVEKTIIRAPTSGTVKVLHAPTVGSVVPAAGPVVDIVPQEGGLLVEVALAPQEVVHVSRGQRATVRIASPDAVRFGHLDAEVVYVGADTVQEQDQEPYYVVRVEADRTYFESNGQRFQLVPGVTVTAGIITGQRSVLEYIFSPIFSSLGSALGER